jgi:cysteine desulfurase
MKVPPRLIRGAVRFSLSRETTPDEIERVLQVLPDVIGKLRALSPSRQERASDNTSLPAEISL